MKVKSKIYAVKALFWIKLIVVAVDASPTAAILGYLGLVYHGVEKGVSLDKKTNFWLFFLVNVNKPQRSIQNPAKHLRRSCLRK